MKMTTRIKTTTKRRSYCKILDRQFIILVAITIASVCLPRASGVAFQNATKPKENSLQDKPYPKLRSSFAVPPSSTEKDPRFTTPARIPLPVQRALSPLEINGSLHTNATADALSVNAAAEANTTDDQAGDAQGEESPPTVVESSVENTVHRNITDEESTQTTSDDILGSPTMPTNTRDATDIKAKITDDQAEDTRGETPPPAVVENAAESTAHRNITDEESTQTTSDDILGSPTMPTNTRDATNIKAKITDDQAEDTRGEKPPPAVVENPAESAVHRNVTDEESTQTTSDDVLRNPTTPTNTRDGANNGANATTEPAFHFKSDRRLDDIPHNSTPDNQNFINFPTTEPILTQLSIQELADINVIATENNKINEEPTMKHLEDILAGNRISDTPSVNTTTKDTTRKNSTEFSLRSGSARLEYAKKTANKMQPSSTHRNQFSTSEPARKTMTQKSNEPGAKKRDKSKVAPKDTTAKSKHENKSENNVISDPGKLCVGACESAGAPDEDYDLSYEIQDYEGGDATTAGKNAVTEPSLDMGPINMLRELAGSFVESLVERLVPQGLRSVLARMQAQGDQLETLRLRSKEENGGLGQFGRSILKGIAVPLSQLMQGVRDFGALDSDRNFFTGVAAGVASGVASVYDSVGDAFKDRVKAIYPGTLWCGDGDMARSEEVGLFFMTDSCCRRHDACRHYIPSGHTKNGLTNTGLFTRSHCECDRAFYRCLKRTNTLVSTQIGVTYFSILGPQCYQREHPIMRCKRRTRITGQRCEEYELDRSQSKIWQWFDNETF